MPVEVEFAFEVERPQWVTYRDVFAVVASWLDRGRVERVFGVLKRVFGELSDDQLADVLSDDQLDDLLLVVAPWLDQGGPERAALGGLSDRAPRHSDRKPYALRGVSARRDLRVRLALLDDGEPGPGQVTVADDLVAGIASTREWDASRELTLGGQQFRTLSVGGDGAGVPHFSEVRRSGWEDLAAVQPAAKWELRFLQPTSFRSDNVYLPFPIAEHILRGVCSVWKAQAPAELHMACPGGVDCVHARVVRVIDYDTSTAKGVPVPLGHSVRTNGERPASSPKSSFLGFQGRVVLGLRTDRGVIPDSVRQEVSTLLALARFAGVGTGTARGYGVTDPRPIRGDRRRNLGAGKEAATSTLT